LVPEKVLTMDSRRVNRVSGKVVLVLSVVALLTVLSGYFQAPQPDEGTAAHIFQLSIMALIPAILLFFATADRKQGWSSARPLVLPAATLIVAFAALYFLEHFFYLH
jgi:hypothetical protein